jgi:integrase
MYIEERGSSLIIRWRFEGRKFHKTLSKHNNPIGRKHAQMVMASIEKDILCGRFDPSDYTQKGKEQKQAIATITVVDLFTKYSEYRVSDRALSNSSKVRFKAIASKLQQLIGAEFLANKLTPEIAANTIGKWSETVNERTARAYLFDLSSAWEWASKEGLVAITVNPWSKPLDKLRGRKLPPSKKPKPFTQDELRAIVDAFDRLPPSYQRYKDIVLFISQTACRFGEMAALTWGDVSDDFKSVTFRRGVSRGHLRDVTKTGNSRLIWLTPTLIALLKARYQNSDPSPDDLVFPSPEGKHLRDNNFRNRVYIPVLAAAGVEYRKPYTYRHSGVSQASADGVSIAVIASQTGHSPQTLMANYLHAIEEKVIFRDYLGHQSPQ